MSNLVVQNMASMDAHENTIVLMYNVVVVLTHPPYRYQARCNGVMLDMLSYVSLADMHISPSKVRHTYNLFHKKDIQ